MQSVDSIDTQVVVIGAGLTGLTTAYWLKRNDVSVHIVETDTRIGGQIQTNHKNYFRYVSALLRQLSTPQNVG